MSRFINRDLYERYKEEVWKLTNAKQRLEPGRPQRGLTDQEIALKLGLAKEEAIEIRCIAEKEMISLEEYLNAEEVKEKRFKTIYFST